MRYIESKEQSAELLRLTLPLMARQSAAYHPISYTIWYEHLAGINPPLSTALAARIDANEPLNDDEVYGLYMRHVSERDAAVLDDLQARLQNLLDDTAQTFNSAGEDTGHFSRTLRESRSDLAEEVTVAKIQQVISRLLSEALRMETMTQILTEKLEGRTQEVKALTQQLQRAQAEAVIDPLCGIHNRRGFLREAKAVLETDSGLAGSALVLADVDHFKQINDTFGHVLGDKVLRSIAGIFRDSIKGRDIAARIGGEEFALLLPQTTLEGARTVAEQIRSTISRGRICRDQNRETIGTITVSLGVAAGAPGESLDTLMFRADQALYAAKRAGRNQVCVESPETQRLGNGEAHLELLAQTLGEDGSAP
jgi:diguanylate cyclase